MKRVRWSLFIIAAVCLYGGFVMESERQQAGGEASQMMSLSLFTAGISVPLDYTAPIVAQDRMIRLAVSDAERAVRQSPAYVALKRREVWATIGAVVGIVVGGLLSIVWVAMIIPVLLRAKVSRSNHRYCPRCKYDLRGELFSGCPECGWRREPAS